MCTEARRLFDDYCAALALAAESGGTSSEQNIRAARGLLTNHNRRHGCCGTLRFERSTSDSTWSFRVVPPSR